MVIPLEDCEIQGNPKTPSYMKDHHKHTQEPKFLLNDDEEIQEQTVSPRIILLGKLVPIKSIHKCSMQSALANIWCNPKNLPVKELDIVLFNIVMDKVEDHKPILKASSWMFINAWLILQKWNGRATINTLEFSKAPIWIKLWGIPINHYYK